MNQESRSINRNEIVTDSFGDSLIEGAMDVSASLSPSSEEDVVRRRIGLARRLGVGAVKSERARHILLVRQIMNDWAVDHLSGDNL